MKKNKTLFIILLCCVVIFLPSCKSIGGFSLNNSELKIGVEGLQGCFNPFYSECDADLEVVSQMFRSIQRKNSDNDFVNYSGGISYEFVGEKQVKYTVSIKDDMYFSDGTNITIDDVIFFYHFIADATYDGVYKDWYLNDIVGLKEFYFDDKNYQSSIQNIEKTIEEKYTVTTIGIQDYSKYLIATKLEGKFSGGLDSVSPSGATWREYLTKLGYSSDLAALGNKLDDNSVLELVARAEAESNPLAYNPESWYREQLYSNYVKENYDDGIDIDYIEGIKKINDYTCTILFNSKNINAISEINIPVVSKDYYSAEYLKGSAETVKTIEGFAVSSGPYVIVDYSDGEVTMTANEYYDGADCDFSTLKFIDLAVDGDDPVKSVKSGKVDVVNILATFENINALTDESVQYFITDCDYYVSMFFNTRTLDSSARKALMGLCSVNNAVEQQIGSYYTRPLRPISVRFPEYPSSLSEPYYNESAFTVYSMANENQIKEVTAYFCGSESDLEYSVLLAYKDTLSKKGITLNIVISDEQTLENAVITGNADIWIETVYDGATCDKYDYYNSSGNFNRTAVNSTEIDSMTAGIRSAVGYSDKAQMTYQLMELVMEQAVECPVYQLQTATVYNTETVSPDSFAEEKNFDGFTYYLPILKKN